MLRRHCSDTDDGAARRVPRQRASRRAACRGCAGRRGSARRCAPRFTKTAASRRACPGETDSGDRGRGWATVAAREISGCEPTYLALSARFGARDAFGVGCARPCIVGEPSETDQGKKFVGLPRH